MLALRSALVLFIGLLTGCRGCMSPELAEVRRIKGMPVENRLHYFSSLPPERQIELYVFAATKIEPPVLFLEVAPNWKRVLPVIKKRLGSEENELSRYQLLWLLAAISENYCALADRKDVLEAAELSIAVMHAYRDLAREPLERIIQSRLKQHPPCE